jgi:hypothetical protein
MSIRRTIATKITKYLHGRVLFAKTSRAASELEDNRLSRKVTAFDR